MKCETQDRVWTSKSQSRFDDDWGTSTPTRSAVIIVDDTPTTPLNKRTGGRSRARREIRRESDGDLVRLAGKGDQDAWHELVHRFGGLIRRVAKRHGLSDSDAADVAQITWLRLNAHHDRLRDPCRIAGWLATTARRESLHIAMSATRQIPSADPVADHNNSRAYVGPGADSSLLRGECNSTVDSALSRLPQQYQRLLRLLSHDAGLSYAEIAKALGVPIGSIGPMRQRAIQLLRRDPQLKPHLPVPPAATKDSSQTKAAS